MLDGETNALALPFEVVEYIGPGEDIAAAAQALPVVLSVGVFSCVMDKLWGTNCVDGGLVSAHENSI